MLREYSTHRMAKALVAKDRVSRVAAVVDEDDDMLRNSTRQLVDHITRAAQRTGSHAVEAMIGDPEGLLKPEEQARLRAMHTPLADNVDYWVRQYGRERAAELVGRMYDSGGNLVVDPDAEWNINGTTNEAASRLVAEAVAKDWDVDRLADALEDSGLFSPDRAEMIARTEISRAQNQAMIKAGHELQQQTGQKVRKIWLLGPHPCPICEENGNDVRELDEAFITDDFAPPLHPNAVLEGYPFASYGSLHQIVRSRYQGPVIELRSLGVGGIRSITIGPNHPVLTRRGFVPARYIHEGDELLYDVLGEGSVGVAEPDLEQVPLIEDAFETLRLSCGTSRVASARTYFHGDEAFIYGEVDVVRPTRRLLTELDASAIKHLGKCELVGTDASADHVAGCRACQSAFDRVFLSASGLVGSIHQRLTLDDVSVSPLGSSVLRTGLAVLEPVRLGSTSPPRFRSFTVLSSHWSMFSGWAFDASTAHALYTIGGLIVKNCMCEIQLVTGLEPQRNEVSDDKWAGMGWQSAEVGPTKVVFHRRPGMLTLGSIETDESARGKGLASKALEEFLSVADREKVAVALQAFPDEEGKGLSQKELEDWYGRYGFVARGPHPEGGTKMVRPAR